MTYRGDASWGDEAAKKSFRSSSTLFTALNGKNMIKVILRGEVVLPIIVNIVHIPEWEEYEKNNTSWGEEAAK